MPVLRAAAAFPVATPVIAPFEALEGFMAIEICVLGMGFFFLFGVTLDSP